VVYVVTMGVADSSGEPTGTFTFAANGGDGGQGGLCDPHASAFNGGGGQGGDGGFVYVFDYSQGARMSNPADGVVGDAPDQTGTNPAGGAGGTSVLAVV
jgi:hypothetical protein